MKVFFTCASFHQILPKLSCQDTSPACEVDFGIPCDTAVSAFCNILSKWHIVINFLLENKCQCYNEWTNKGTVICLMAYSPSKVWLQTVKKMEHQGEGSSCQEAWGWVDYIQPVKQWWKQSMFSWAEKHRTIPKGLYFPSFSRKPLTYLVFGGSQFNSFHTLFP